MKSVIVTIIMFIGLYVVVQTGIFDFLSQSYVFPTVIGLIVAMFIVIVVTLGLRGLKEKGVKDDKDTHLD